MTSVFISLASMLYCFEQEVKMPFPCVHDRWRGIILSTLTLCLLLLPMALASQRFEVIEDFESGSVNLLSWLDEDVNPSAWQLTATNTYNGSAYSLQLTGNTWKQQLINPVAVDSGAVFQIAGMTANGARIQGIGFCDSTNVIFYSLSGSEILDLEEWVPVYQGAFSHGQWNLFQFPIADDWFSFFDYLPTITSIVYVNDLDGVSNRSVYFDSILNISSDIGIAPTVTATCQITFQSRLDSGARDVGVQFQSVVNDPDSNIFTYAWDFGDGAASSLANPYHTYTVTDDHPYRATLKVTDDTGKWGFASCLVDVDQGEDSLPLRINFVGDVMLARRYESTGGIIPTQGVNAIFEPTLPLLGNAADITVANLEVVLCNTGSPHPTKSVVYRGSPANVSGLAYAGIDRVTLANNHTLDYGLEGLNQMRGVLDDNDIVYSGAGANSYEAYTPSFVNKSGLNIAFLASCDRTGQYNNAQPYLQAGYNKYGFAYMTPYYNLQQLAAVDGIADLKVMELHGGSEYSLSPGSGYDKSNPFSADDQDEDYDYRTDVPHMWDIAIRHHAVEAGADLVIVHHPHIIHGMEVYQGKLIAHSLGNYIFDLDYPETMPTIILYADADHSGFSNFLIKPVYIDYYIPKPATGQLGKYILDYLAMRSTELNTKLIVDYDNVSATVLMDDGDAVVTSHPYTFNEVLTNRGAEGNVSDPIKLPRHGSISSVSEVSPVGDAMLRLGVETIWYGNFEDEGSTLWSSAMGLETINPFDGAQSAILTPNYGQTSTGTIQKRCKWYDNTKKLTLHGWIKTRDATNANILIRYYNTRTGNSIGNETITANISGTTDWTWYYKELTVPSNAWYFDIRLTCTNSTGGNVQALFDNVGLIEWTPWETFNPINLFPTPNNYYWMQMKTMEAPKSVNISFTELRYGRAAQRKGAVPPADLGLKAWPNPFRDKLSVSFDTSGKARTRLEVYNLRGQKVRTLTSELLPAGKHGFAWDAKDDRGSAVASGIYFIRLENDGKSGMRKVVLLK
jgi:poly-gamma-glutamate capsule biosynthesis protein CapA/YwtB (metallophosphatase superfamily)